MKAPLAGLIVADFSRVLSAPLTTMNLGDLGAEVFKVERPGQGDETRQWGPPFVDGFSSYFLAINRNKRSVTLDLQSPEGLDAALKLIDRSDVLVENFRPGTMERLGLGPEAMMKRNPRLVYCSISGFGTGLGRDLPGYDFLVQAAGGLMSLTGEEDQPPMKTGVALVDVLTGLNATIAVLAALRSRDATGVGQLVHVSLISSLLAGMVNQISTYVTAGTLPSRLGNRHPSIAPYELFETQDRPIVVAVGNDRQFSRLCAALDLPQLAEDERYASNPLRVEHRAELAKVLEDALRRASATHWLSRLVKAGIASGPVNDMREAIQFAQSLGIEPIVGITDSAGRTFPQVASPIELLSTPPEYRLPPPRLGEHTEETLLWLEEENRPAVSPREPSSS